MTSCELKVYFHWEGRAKQENGTAAPHESVSIPYTHIWQSSSQKGVFDDNLFYFSTKPYDVTPHLNRLDETVQMRGHNICFMQINHN